MKSYIVKNLNGETFEVDENKISEAEKDGFLPVVTNGTKEFRVESKNLKAAKLDGFTPLQNISNAESFVRGAVQAGSLGFADEIEAGARSLMQNKPYETTRNEIRAQYKQAEMQNPKSYLSGNVTGGIASAFIPGMNVAKGVSIGKAAMQGAALGAANALGSSDAENLSMDQIKDIGAGGAIGLGFGALGQSVGKLGDKSSKGLKSSAENLAQNATGATRAQSEKFKKNIGRVLLDKKIVSFGDEAEDIAKKAANKIKEAELEIDKSLKNLDSKGAFISQDEILQNLVNKKEELLKDPSMGDIVKQLDNIINNIYETGQSKILPSEAEKIKRGFDRLARNWLDPEKGQAGKIAYREYKNAVETLAKKVDPETAIKFQEAKKVYGLLNPIQEAAEKRALQLNQHPLGGFLDMTSGAGAAATTAMAGGDLVTSGLAGIAAPLARRVIAPKMSSMGAVIADKTANAIRNESVKSGSKALNQGISQSLTSGLVNKNNNERSDVNQKWLSNGLNSLININPNLDQEIIDYLIDTKQGQSILLEADVYKDNPERLKQISNKILQLKNEVK